MILRDDLEELEMLKSDSTALPSQAASFAPKNRSAPIGNAKFVNTLRQIDSLENKIKQNAAELESKEEIIRQAINKLPSFVEMQVIKYRYIHGMIWELIADKIGYSYRQTLRIHKQALKNIKLPPEGVEKC